jgi:hypothetical protein
MLRNEASIRQLFYWSCTADRSFVPQDDREMGYVVPQHDKGTFAMIKNHLHI